MDLFKFIMLMLYTMVPNYNVPVTSNGNSVGDDVQVEFEIKNMPAMPPGFHFVPSGCLLIMEYLVKKIVGVPLASDMVKVRDGIQRLDPEQHRFEDEFAHCQNNHAYYITNKAPKTEESEAGGTKTIIKTTSGYWREKRKDISIFNEDGQIIGYKTRYIFCRGQNEETSWRMDEFTVKPEILPANARDQIKETIACGIRVKKPKTPEGTYYEFEEFNEDEELEDAEDELPEEEVIDENNVD